METKNIIIFIILVATLAILLNIYIFIKNGALSIIPIALLSVTEPSSISYLPSLTLKNTVLIGLSLIGILCGVIGLYTGYKSSKTVGTSIRQRLQVSSMFSGSSVLIGLITLTINSLVI